ncbi:16S rRNA methyltransferase [Marichromatium purpuratum 984]|uniref:Ribosomal RNA small subunit methyltransferase E n=1 Tax=Marichromatium purpuratum 984 TaxID=765910 RepID=W0E7Q1_MARPU|nr:16S rRNA (uracil(1498)-N(3))-methyltransferase [Marichromatium purpuratum]AHF05229.1 16S rRNA methyltransferase [Marichromatium purpuratum 984]
MRIPRVHVDQPLTADADCALPSGPARHLAQVLRLGPGAEVVLFDGSGHDFPATIAHSGRDGVAVRLGAPGLAEPAPRLEIHLALGVSKGERMDFALQKAVELGVTRITPLRTERSVVRLDGARLARRLDHWRGVIVSACEQSGRRRLPRLDDLQALPDWLPAGWPGGLILDPRAERALTTLTPPETGVTLLIGPEGGLSEREINQARAQGFTGVRLGPRVLRTETAPLAAIALIQGLWGDLGD